MTDVLMRLTPPFPLVPFVFAVDDVVYQSFQRSIEYRWPAQERINALAALQWTGVGSDTISLEGVIYPQHTGKIDSIDPLRTLAAAGKPMGLTDGRGRHYGRWVITGVTESANRFFTKGVPRKVSFSLSLRKFDNGR